MNQKGETKMIQYASKGEARMSMWARTFFFEKLTEQGFVSYQDKGLSWYKVIGNNLLQTVYLFSDTNLMLEPALGFGCHPLFIPAPLPQKLTVTGYGWDDVQMSIRQFPGPKLLYRDFSVLFSKEPEAGVSLLDEVVFPHFSKLHTIEDAYHIHRDTIQTRMNEFLSRRSWADYNGFVAGWDFIDELIYMGDWAMLKYCDRDLSPSFCHNDRDRKRVNSQRDAIRGEMRDEFLLMLEKRKKRFANRLEKNLGISISI